MNKPYAIYLAVVTTVLAAVAACTFDLIFADISAVAAYVTEGLWFFAGPLSMIALVFAGAFVFLVLFRNMVLDPAGFQLLFLGGAFGFLSFLFVEGNLPATNQSSFDNLPANWETNLTLLGLLWAFLILAAIGRRIFSPPAPSNTPDGADEGSTEADRRMETSPNKVGF